MGIDVGAAITAGAATLRPAVVVELLKPVTWFPPMWAFGCGIVSVAGSDVRWPVAAAGVLLCGPLVCGTSQAVNDWYDRHVDAINEPGRPIPSGRIPGRWGLFIAMGWTVVSLLVATILGPWGFGATVLGLTLAWAYSAPPLRLKLNGWWGNTACAVCYEGLPWFTGAAIMAAARPGWHVMAFAALYSFGAHGIMTLNDFKSVEGDRQMGVGSLPVKLGIARSAELACAVMAVPQVAVVALLLAWGFAVYAAAVVVLLTAQIALMARLLADPRGRAPWYQATGISLYVLGMMICAVALRAGA